MIVSLLNRVCPDYLQSLQDENKINVEKIGSGNWYWSFPSQEKQSALKTLDEAQSAYDKVNAVNQDLKFKLAEAQALRADEEDMLDNGGESREELVAIQGDLEGEMKVLQKELAAYSDDDPTELERKKKEVARLKMEAGQYTDEIDSMEGWFKELMSGDTEQLRNFREKYYGDELDAEEGVLRELL